MEQFNANQVYIAWDRKLSKEANFRNTLTDGTYKNNRDEDRNKEVYGDVDNIIELVSLLGVKNIFPGKLEADDVISWLSKNIEGKKIIISVDRDFIQLIGEDISYFNPIKKQLVDITNFEEVYELTPKEYLYYKAIVGDPSDNIAGIVGFGKVKGAKIAKAYRAFCENREITEKEREIIGAHMVTIENNLKLMDLSYGLKQFKEETDLYLEQTQKLDENTPDFVKFKELCEKYEFLSILSKMSEWQATFNKQANSDLLAEYFKSFT